MIIYGSFFDTYILGGPTFVGNNTNDARKITLLSYKEQVPVDRINDRWEKQTLLTAILL